MIVSIGQEFGVTLIGVIASMRIAGGALLVASVLCFTHANPAEAGLPKWFSQASEIETPAYAESSHALILFRERRVEVEKSGRVNLEERCVLRVLTEEGGQQARASVFYRTDHEEVTALRAWLVDPLGRQEQYGEGDAFDVALLDEALYSEARVRSIVPSDEVGPGVVFGYEYELEIEPLFYQFEWDVSRGLPAVEARFALKLPKGWKVDSRFRKLPTVTPLPGKKEVIWVFEELPEPTSPIGSVSAKDWPSFGVSCWVDGEESGLSSMCFREWGEVSNWLDRLSEPSAEINGEMLSLAQNLVAGVRGELDTLRAVAEYVQDLRYVAIEMGLGRGGGYRPRPAPEVLRTSYGDCKDKSNLMRTLLRALGKQSYLMAIYSGMQPGWTRIGSLHSSLITAFWPSRCGAIPGSRQLNQSPASGQHCYLTPPTPRRCWEIFRPQIRADSPS